MTKHHLSYDSPWLLALLAALVALGPLSIDMYMPAMPAMQVAFDTTISRMHLTISVYLVGYSLFHLLCGPLADRFGRRPILLGGAALFVLACLGCSQATTVEEVLWYRFSQGIGACVGPTLARTIARDVFGPTRAAKALSLIAMMMGLAPAVAPTLGGIMLLVLPWSSIFIFLGIYGVATMVLIIRYLPESLPMKQSLHPVAIWRNYAELIANRTYLTVTFASGLTYAGMLAYLSSSSFVYIEMLGVPVQFYGPIFLTTVLGYMTGSALSARLSHRLPSETILLLGSSVGPIATLTMCGSYELFHNSILPIMVPVAAFTCALGLIMPHAMTIALRPFAHIAGTASALLGFIQMSLSAATSALVGIFLQETPRPMVLTMVVVAFIGLTLTIRVYRSRSLTTV